MGITCEVSPGGFFDDGSYGDSHPGHRAGLSGTSFSTQPLYYRLFFSGLIGRRLGREKEEIMANGE